jgi:hypothetical protein
MQIKGNGFLGARVVHVPNCKCRWGAGARIDPQCKQG